MPERREFTPRVRARAKHRDASLIVIATEGIKTEHAYFNGLIEMPNYHSPRLHVEVLERLCEGNSSPEEVIKSLDDFKRKFKLHPERGDQLWMVCDVDRWDRGMLSEVASLCLQKEYCLAISNPCFELWLLLHHKDLMDYPVASLDEFRGNRRVTGKRTRLDQELLAVIGHYDKSNLRIKDFGPHIDLAIQRARAIDNDSEARWPQDLGSRVYLLIESIRRIINYQG